MEFSFLSNVKSFGEWINGNQKWVQLYPYSSWTHPIYSDTKIDRETAEKLVRNFNDKVMGRDLVVEYDHGLDKAKGGKAAGKVIKQEAREDGLYGLVEFNDVAKAEIDSGEWNWMSNSHYDEWTDPQSGVKHTFVPENPSLTNRPYVRGMVPLNFSEVIIESPKEHAVLSAAQRKSLPDSAYMYIAPDGTRYFPFKHADGSLDKVHLQKITQLAPKAQVPDNVKQRVIARAKALLAKMHTVIELEPLDISVDEAIEIQRVLVDEGVDTVLDADMVAWIREQMDKPKGGETVNPDEILAAIRQKLGLGDDVDLVTHVDEMNAELIPLRELRKEHSEKKRFSEMYPEEAAELENARKYRQEQEVKQFSDSIASKRVTRSEKKPDSDEVNKIDTGLGFSGLALEKIGEMAKEFSEGAPTFDTFKGVLDGILDNGIVDYSTHGSSRVNDNEVLEDADLGQMNSQQVRKAFSDRINDIMVNDKIDDYDTAYALAANKHPELYAAYKGNKPVAGNK